jgi:hypothetical protein
VAGLAFVPVLGLFFGAGAVTWALISDRPRAKLSLVIAATGALLNVAVPMFVVLTMQHGEAFARVEAQQTREDLTKLVFALQDYRGRAGRYHAPGLLRVPRFYEYHLSADGESYDLFSVGPDGVPHTADDIRPDLPDSLRGRAGYRPTP